jgi:hypothetical protein
MPVHPAAEGCPVHGTAGGRQVASGSGHRTPGGQDGPCRPLQLHLRHRGGTEPGRGVQRKRQGAAAMPQARPPHHRRYGLKKLPKQAGEYLFEIIMRRHELRSTVMTSNRPLEVWGKLVGDVPTATAILDRFLSRAEVIQITRKSYRLRDNACKNKNEHGKENDH